VASLGEVELHWRAQVGRHRSEVDTPALILDRERLQRNILTMADFVSRSQTSLRPHVKIHKSSNVARMQIDAGAVGVTCATIAEATVMANGGIGSILVANEFLSETKLRALAYLARSEPLVGVMVTVDDVAQIDALSATAIRHGITFGVLVELDVGMGRCGVANDSDVARLAEYVCMSGGVSFHGIQGYEGHCMMLRTSVERSRRTQDANSRLVEVADYVASAGFPATVVSAGGTGTYTVTGANAGITELQAGSYTLMDAFHNELTQGEFELAVSVAGTVVSRRGNQVVLDCGLEAAGDTSPLLRDCPVGHVAWHGEEHTIVQFAGPLPELGAVVEVVPGYASNTLRLYDAYLVTEGDVVSDVWPIFG
jgi:D-serine deaminase-like pyridoxal phosphate-dependent protein